MNWLDYHQDRRLWAKLAEVTARELVWLTRKRAQTLHLYVAPSQLDTLRSSMCLSGASSEHGQLLGVKPHEHITEGYLAYDDFEQLKEGLPHSPGLDPTAIIHLYRDLPFGTLPGNGQMPIAVAAADLAGSRETHEREQGLSWLERILTALHDSLA
ncbi:MAG: hypothetical protein LBP24_03380 [Coriobacteriales bacterium]|nr:hypothetical protein [Coriobacteriales bacterium]